MNSYPKIFALGTKYISDLLLDKVEITEKLDGSQFSFGKINGEIKMRSKSQDLTVEYHDKMFNEAVEYIVSIQDTLPEGVYFYCEYLKKPKHNTLAYDNIPKNHLCLFGACTTDEDFKSYPELIKYAKKLQIDVAPLIFQGGTNPEGIKEFLKRESYLGGAEIEGVVVKAYRPFMLGDRVIPLTAGKYVSEKFKEVHKKEWKRGSSKSKWEVFVEGYRTEARWEKAVQHLKEQGELEEDPKDIGKLCVEVQKDIGQEEKENIKNFLWKEFGKQLMRRSVAGLPDWYKDKLLTNK